VVKLDDPLDHNQASGTGYGIHQSFLREGARVKVVGPFNYPFSFPERILRKINQRLFNKTLFKYPARYFSKSASQVNDAIRTFDPDLIVSMYSAPLVYAHLTKPFLYFCDATTRWEQTYWRNRAWISTLTMSIWESKVIDKATHIISFSDANAKFMHENHQVDREQIDVFAIPASIPHNIVPSLPIEKKKFSSINLLLVGRDYYRKGIDLAIEIVNDLANSGINARLRIAGLEGTDKKNVKYMGYYNKTNPQELRNYIANYEWSDFLIHPARFEAAGIVPSEAAKFGVPTITNDIGGLATTVKDGISGVVLPKLSPIEGYTRVIRDFMNKPAEYDQLVKTTLDRYQQELNWPAISPKIMQIAKQIIDKN